MSHDITVAGGTSVLLPTAGKYCAEDIIITATGGGGGSGGLPAGYSRVDYIQFTGGQTVDTGIICNQNSKIHLAFTRERSTQHYMYGVASSGNTASVTAYMGGELAFWK